MAPVTDAIPEHFHFDTLFLARLHAAIRKIVGSRSN
jgi:hypothetical protein